MVVDALVLAGGELERERFAGAPPETARKAQLPLLGRPMVEWVVRGLRASQRVQRVVVVGDPSLDTPALRDLAVRLVPEQGGIAANLRAGLDALPGGERLLAVSGDLPLLHPEALEDLLDHAPNADLVFPYVERADIERLFPHRGWIYARTPEGELTGASAALARPEALRTRWRWVEELLHARRKSVLALAAMIGPVFALKYLCGRLRPADVEARLSRLLGLTARGYRTRFPELAMDVDKYTDIAVVESVLRARG